jgi:hypothetical protein
MGGAFVSCNGVLGRGLWTAKLLAVLAAGRYVLKWHLAIPDIRILDQMREAETTAV